MHYRSVTKQLIPLLTSLSSLAFALTLRGIHGTHNRNVFFHKTILSFFIAAFFYTVVSKSLTNRGKSGSLQGANRQRKQIQLYKRVSRSCLVKTPHLVDPLQVNNWGRCPPLGPGTHSPLSIGRRGGGSLPFSIAWHNL